MTDVLGNIHSLWRYPVKSMLGERCEALCLDERGIEGDRLFAVRDADGKFGSGKDTRRFRRMDGLLMLEASYRGQVPLLKFPDQRVVDGNEPAVHDALSEVLEQPVTLVREAGISHFDDSPVHIVTSASLAWLRAALPDAAIDERRFRANLFLDVPGVTPVEHGWVGSRVRVGEEVVLEISKPAERCVMTSSEQKGLPCAPEILRTIVQRSGRMLGVYARVVAGGVVRVTDVVRVLGSDG